MHEKITESFHFYTLQDLDISAMHFLFLLQIYNFIKTNWAKSQFLVSYSCNQK